MYLSTIEFSLRPNLCPKQWNSFGIGSFLEKIEINVYILSLVAVDKIGTKNSMIPLVLVFLGLCTVEQSEVIRIKIYHQAYF